MGPGVCAYTLPDWLEYENFILDQDKYKRTGFPPISFFSKKFENLNYVSIGLLDKSKFSHPLPRRRPFSIKDNRIPSPSILHSFLKQGLLNEIRHTLVSCLSTLFVFTPAPFSLSLSRSSRLVAPLEKSNHGIFNSSYYGRSS